MTLKTPNIDNVDLFDLFKSLWDQKWIIISFILLTVLITFGFQYNIKQKFVSKVSYVVDTIPPFYNHNRAISDFKKMYYTRKVFDNWKNETKNVSLSYDQISLTNIVDGIELSKKAKPLTILRSNQLIIKTNDLLLLNDVYNYCNFINGILKIRYVKRAKEELNIIETRFKDFSTANDAIIGKLLDVDRYIVAAEQGSKVFIFYRPTYPINDSIKSSILYFLSIVIGGIIGSFFVLVLEAIRLRNQNLKIN